MNYKIPEKWANAVNNGNLEEILGCYGNNASLISTFQSKPILSSQGIREYFHSFITKDGAGVTVDLDNLNFFEVEDYGYLSVGLYEFFFLEDGELVRHPARFSFIVEVDQGQKITHHHSSLLPINS